MGGYVGIPVSYTPVEYIESSGTQYVDTGYKMSNNSKIVAKLSMADTNIMTAVGVSGSYQSFSIQSYNGNYRIRWRSGATSNIQVDSSIPIGTEPHIFEVNSTNAKIDGTVIGNTNSYQFTENSNLFICAMSNNNSPLNLATGRIYYYQIYEYDVLVRDFIPVLDDNNVACLYDLVEGKFYYNKGTGTFTTGNTTDQPVIVSKARKIKKAYVGVSTTYTPVEYIENSGTQYIDTGFAPNYSSGFKFELKAAPSVLGVRYCPISNYDSSTTNHVTGEITANNEGRFYMNGGALDAKQSGVVLGENTLVWEYYNGNYKITVNNSVKSGTYSASTQLFVTLLLFVDRLYRFSTFSNPLKLYYCKIYDGQTLARDFIPVIDQDGIACLYDLVEGKFYYNRGSGAFASGNTIGQPVIIGNTARKIIKGYVGVNGYASLCYYKAIPTYKTYIENTAHNGVASIQTTENHYIIAGGSPNNSTPVKTVTAYSKEFVATSCPDLTNQAWFQASTNFNGYAIFAGGKTASSGSSRTNQSAAYSDNLTKTTLSNLWDSVYESASASNETHCIIGGGSNYNAYQTACRSYDKNFSMSSPSNFSSARYACSGASIGDYLVFVGSPNNSSASTDFYDNSNVKTTSSTPYNKIANYMLGLNLDDYAVFFGGTSSGNNASNAFANCAAYDSNKVLYKFSLPAVAMGAQGFSTGEYAWVGYNNKSYVYDNNLVLREQTTEAENIYGNNWSRSAAILNYGIEQKGASTRFNIFYA